MTDSIDPPPTEPIINRRDHPLNYQVSLCLSIVLALLISGGIMMTIFGGIHSQVVTRYHLPDDLRQGTCLITGRYLVESHDFYEGWILLTVYTEKNEILASGKEVQYGPSRETTQQAITDWLDSHAQVNRTLMCYYHVNQEEGYIYRIQLDPEEEIKEVIARPRLDFIITGVILLLLGVSALIIFKSRNWIVLT